MSWIKRRRTAALAAAALFAWMLWNLFSGPTYAFGGSASPTGNPAFSVRCEPMIWRASWVEDWHASGIDGHHHSYTVTEGLEPRSQEFRTEWERRHREPFDLAAAQTLPDDTIRGELSALCADARTGQAGLMALVAVPAALLAVLGFAPRRRWVLTDLPPDGPPTARRSATTPDAPGGGPAQRT